MYKRIQTTRVARRAAGLSVLLFGVAFIAQTAWCDTPPGPTDEESVLVATRQSLSEDAAGEAGTLEPIAADADRTPDLADEDALTAGEEGAEVPLDAALAEVARAQQQAEEERAAPQLVEKPTLAEAPAPEPALPAYEPVKFNGIQPGTSTKDDLVESWGEPAESISTSDGAVLTYHKVPFEAIEVLVSPDDVVAAVKIKMAGSLKPDALAKQLSLDEVESVTATDAEGNSLGESFPERGVLFMYDNSSDEADAGPAVRHVVIQSLDAKAFALRAERRLHGPYGKNIRDLETALSIDPKLSVAQWLLSEIYLATGQADLADAAANKALELEPDNGAYQLRKAQTLRLLGQYDEAVQQVRAVLDREDVQPLVKAEALHEMAHLASLGNSEIAAKAMSFESKAIEIADHLATSQNVKERRAAKRLLVEAHVTMAGHVARQPFDSSNKMDSLGEWFGRASGLAEDFIANDGGSLELRLLIAREALGALASFKSTADPSPWVNEAEETATALSKQCDDPLWQKRIQWELGTAYLQALKIEHTRRETEAALRYGGLAIDSLAEGAKPRQAVHSTENLVGELYFEIGVVHAIHKQDHKTAAKWYDKALPLLTSTRPPSELYSPRHEGEELVSMGVSYWQTGKQDRALELTEAGAVLVEMAVDDGVLAKSALAVPYGNLASIYEQLGKAEDAAKYAKLAKSAEAGPAQRNTRAPAEFRSGQNGTSQTHVANNGGSRSSSAKSSSTRPPRRFNTARAGSPTTSQMR